MRQAFRALALSGWEEISRPRTSGRFGVYVPLFMEAPAEVEHDARGNRMKTLCILNLMANVVSRRSPGESTGRPRAADRHINPARHLGTQAPAHFKKMGFRYASP